MSLIHENGWHQVAVAENSCAYGDDAISEAWTAYYEKVNTDWRGEIGYYTVFSPFPDIDGGEPTDAWGVECCVEVYREVDGDQHDHEIDYDYGDVRYFHTIESADQRARELAERDESYVFII